MFGKHYTSMYYGSMVGRGALFFAVWGYVISNFIPDRKHGAIVELNPKVIALMLSENKIAGEQEEDVARVIGLMCEPDPKSSSKVDEGRKLIRLSEFQYRVVNGAMYRAIRNQDERKRQNREAQERFRAKALKSSKPAANEARYLKALKRGAPQSELDRIVAEGT